MNQQLLLARMFLIGQIVGFFVSLQGVGAIVGGNDVQSFRYPYFTLLEIEVDAGTLICGASLIHDDILLTAASCWKESFSAIAYIGARSIKKEAGSYVASCDVIKSVKHPSFSNRQVSIGADLMLLKLDPKCQFDAKKITLPMINTDANRPIMSAKPWVVGLGVLSSVGFIDPETLQHAQLDMISIAKCNSATSYGNEIKGGLTICAGATGGGKDSCNGDGGGPLVIKTSSAIAGDVIVGVVSGGEQDKCGHKNFPGVYTRVSKYHTWIQSNLCSLTKRKPNTCPSVGFACFSSDAIVNTRSKGSIPMSMLAIGDQVQVSTSGKYDTVYSFGHRHFSVTTEYLMIWTSSNKAPLEISRHHMMFVEKDGISRPLPASLVQVGDTILSTFDQPTTVTEITVIEKQGAFAPFTYTGTIVVNDLLASSYVSFDEYNDSLHVFGFPIGYHFLAYLFESPHRIASRLGLCPLEMYSVEGISVWVDFPLRVGKNWLLHQLPLVRSLILLPAIILFGFLLLLETMVLDISCLAVIMIVVLTTSIFYRKSTKIVD